VFRKEKEIADREEMEAIIRESPVIHIGLADNGLPYVVPMNFAFRGGRIFLHSSPRGLKMEMLRRNPHVCFEIDISHKALPGENICTWGFGYRSVIGFGQARFIDDPAQKREAMELIAGRYAGNISGDIPEERLRSVAIISIDIESMTGKRSG
jgi:nitroimidazol reductase NimA-like FMN-containing flavoprotein (pyridoxamine 5'-phosphate oxidase superfamily)